MQGKSSFKDFPPVFLIFLTAQPKLTHPNFFAKIGPLPPPNDTSTSIPWDARHFASWGAPRHNSKTSCVVRLGADNVVVDPSVQLVRPGVPIAQMVGIGWGFK